MDKIYLLKFNKDNFNDGDIFLKDCLNHDQPKNIPLVENEYTKLEKIIGYVNLKQDDEGIYVENSTIDLDEIKNNLGFAGLFNKTSSNSEEGKRTINDLKVYKIIPLKSLTFKENDKS
jgi:hypothetical protein